MAVRTPGWKDLQGKPESYLGAGKDLSTVTFSHEL